MPNVDRSVAEHSAVGHRRRRPHALLHRHEIVRRLIPIHLRNGILDRSYQCERLDRSSDRQDLSRVDPLVLAAILREVLTERNVDRCGLFGLKTWICHVGDDADDLSGLRLRDRIAARAD